jgi:hypothetical protein
MVGRVCTPLCIQARVHTLHLMDCFCVEQSVKCTISADLCIDVCDPTTTIDTNTDFYVCDDVGLWPYIVRAEK